MESSTRKSRTYTNPDDIKLTTPQELNKISDANNNLIYNELLLNVNDELIKSAKSGLYQLEISWNLRYVNLKTLIRLFKKLEEIGLSLTIHTIAEEKDLTVDEILVTMSWNDKERYYINPFLVLSEDITGSKVEKKHNKNVSKNNGKCVFKENNYGDYVTTCGNYIDEIKYGEIGYIEICPYCGKEIKYEFFE